MQPLNVDLTASQTKPLIQSRVISFNTVNLVLGFLWPFLPKKYYSDPWFLTAAVSWLTVGNIVLRFFTTTAISIYKKTHTVDVPVAGVAHVEVKF